MFKNLGLFLVKLLTFFLFIIIGIWLGSKAFQLWSKADSTGIFVRWHPLKGQQKFEHIFYAHSREVWARANTGIDYVYRTGACDDMKCYEWLEGKSDTQFNLGMQQINRSGCQQSYQYYINSDPLSRRKPRYPPQNTASPAECVLVIEHNPYNGAESQINYVLLDNGDIWMWKYSPDLSREFVLFFAFPVAGLVIGIIIWYGFQKSFSQTKLQAAT